MSGRFSKYCPGNPDGANHSIEINPNTGAMIADIGPMYDESGNGCAIGDPGFQPGTNILFDLAANQSDTGTRCIIGGAGIYLLTINTSNARLPPLAEILILEIVMAALPVLPTVRFT